MSGRRRNGAVGDSTSGRASKRKELQRPTGRRVDEWMTGCGGEARRRRPLVEEALVGHGGASTACGEEAVAGRGRVPTTCGGGSGESRRSAGRSRRRRRVAEECRPLTKERWRQ